MKSLRRLLPLVAFLSLSGFKENVSLKEGVEVRVAHKADSKAQPASQPSSKPAKHSALNRGSQKSLELALLGWGRACADITQVRKSKVIWHEEGRCNQITNAGRDYLHEQGYQGTGAGQGSYTAGNGFNYIALTNTAITPAAGDTTLSGEISSNGLSRAQGTVTHTTGTNTTAITFTFTATATQSAQATALFTASSSGTMNHELTFSQRTLLNGDQLIVTFTITLGAGDMFAHLFDGLAMNDDIELALASVA